jgi:hypothetical protein
MIDYLCMHFVGGSIKCLPHLVTHRTGKEYGRKQGMLIV